MPDDLFDPVGGTVLVEQRARTVVLLWGELDEAIQAQADDTLGRALRRRRPLVVDGRRVTFFGSAGVVFLSRLCEMAHEEGLTVTLLEPSLPVREVLALLGLAEMFDATVVSDPASS